MARDEELLALVQGEHTDAARALEGEALADATGDAEERLVALAREMVAAWVRAFGGPRTRASDETVVQRLIRTLREALRRLLAGIAGRTPAVLERALPSAVTLGAEQSAEVLALLRRPLPRVSPEPSEELRAEAAEVPELTATETAAALALLTAPLVAATGLTGLLAGVGRARTAVSRIRARMAAVLGRAVNEGLTASVRAAGGQKLWVAERDACTACAAYAGRTAAVGEEFPGGLDWDPQRRGATGALLMPPRHPHCRCRVIPWLPRWAPGLPNLIAQQAGQAVAAGQFRPGDSQASRIRAAREVLRSGAELPGPVRRLAADAVRAGRFPTTRPAASAAAG